MRHPLDRTARTLLANRSYDIEFHGYLTNHVKHAMVALNGLEAPPSRLQDYWDQYTAETPYGLTLDVIPPQAWKDTIPATVEEFTTWRGAKVHWRRQVLFLQHELQTNYHGHVDDLIRRFAPELLPGMLGSLTHGIIHLGWAIDAHKADSEATTFPLHQSSQWMILEGLAYLNFCHVGIDPALFDWKANDNSDTTPMESFQRVATIFESDNLKETWVHRVKTKYDETFHPELVRAGFQWQVAKLAHEPHDIATTLPAWLTTMDSSPLWEYLYRDITLIYLATCNETTGQGNFLVLHLITSLWGVEQVCMVLKEEDALIRRALGYYYAMTILLLSAGSSGFPSHDSLQRIQREYPRTAIDDRKAFDWRPIVDAAMAEVEEHNIKLVYVMRELWSRYGGWKGYSAAAKSFTVTPNIDVSLTTKA